MNVWAIGTTTGAVETIMGIAIGSVGTTLRPPQVLLESPQASGDITGADGTSWSLSGTTLKSSRDCRHHHGAKASGSRGDQEPRAVGDGRRRFGVESTLRSYSHVDAGKLPRWGPGQDGQPPSWCGGLPFSCCWPTGLKSSLTISACLRLAKRLGDIQMIREDIHLSLSRKKDGGRNG